MHLVQKGGQIYSLGFRRVLSALGAVTAGRDPVFDDSTPFNVINLDELSKEEARRMMVSLIEQRYLAANAKE